MSFTAVDPIISYAGDDVQLAFTFSFPYIEEGDITVTLVDSSGVETLQTITTQYSITSTAPRAGGTVTMVTEPATGETLVISRDVALSQETDYRENDPFPAETHEEGLDRAMMAVADARRDIDQSIRFPADESPSTNVIARTTERASKYAGYDASGDLAVYEGTPSVPATAYMATLLDDADAATARTTLGVPSSSEDTTVRHGFEVTSQDTLAIGDPVGSWNGVFGEMKYEELFTDVVLSQHLSVSAMSDSQVVYGKTSTNQCAAQFATVSLSGSTITLQDSASEPSVTAGTATQVRVACIDKTNGYFVIAYITSAGACIFRIGEDSGSGVINWLITEETVQAGPLTTSDLGIVSHDNGFFSIMCTDQGNQVYLELFEYDGTLTSHTSALPDVTDDATSCALYQGDENTFGLIYVAGSTAPYTLAPFTYTFNGVDGWYSNANRVKSTHTYPLELEGDGSSSRKPITMITPSPWVRMAYWQDTGATYGYEYKVIETAPGSFGQNAQTQIRDVIQRGSDGSQETIINLGDLILLQAYREIVVLDENCKPQGVFDSTFELQDADLLGDRLLITRRTDSSDAVWKFPRFVGLATTAVTGPGTVTVRRHGYVSGLSGLTAGRDLYVDVEAGTLSHKAIGIKIGIAISATEATLD